MKVLVTGGSGFIGSHVVDKLRDKGVKVRVYDCIMPLHRDDIEYYQGSILDIAALGFAMSGIDVVMHLAAIADVKDVLANPHYSEAINVRGTINVLEAARGSKVRRVIYGSTTWVYSETELNNVDETTPLHAPSHFYTATKLAGEYYCQTYSKLYDLDVTILRYGIPYGPRARDSAVIPIFVKKALNGEPLIITGDGSQFRKFVYVEDLAEGNVLALQSIARNKIYNLDGNERITIKEVAETIQKIVGNVEIEYIQERLGDFSGKEVSGKLAERELEWSPKVNFEEGVRRYIVWYKKREERRRNDWEQINKELRG
tara:strand:- start:67 stop:1011 length:945 start_codon:yes stop_codon:yes gene_type:complete